MEIKAELQKPYTDEDRTNFIIINNRQLNYEIRETETALEAWGYTEEEIAQKEQERINNLTMTALDFINFLKQAGLTDEMIELYLNDNLNVKHQLMFCQNVYCGVAKALMPVTVGNITITADMVELAFRIKNGEVTE